MTAKILAAVISFVLVGPCFNPALSARFPPSPKPPAPGQQSIEEQNEIFRMLHMTEEEGVEYRKQLRKATYPAESAMVIEERNHRMRQRATEGGFSFYEETVPGWPGAGQPSITGPENGWICWSFTCKRKYPPVILP